MLIFLYGPDDYRAKEKIKELKNKYLKEVDMSGSGIKEFFDNQWSLGELKEVMGTGSLFARKEMILIEGAIARKDKVFLEEMAELMTKTGDNIVIVYEPRLTLDKNKELKFLDSEVKEIALSVGQKKLSQALLLATLSQCFERLNSSSLEKWMFNKSKKLGVGITRQASMAINLLSQGDLWAINNELEKLAAFILGADKNNKIIELEDVELFNRNKTDYTIFALTDALGTRNKVNALAALENLMEEGAVPMYLMTMLMKHFRTLLAVKDYLDKGENSARMASKLGLHSYVVQKSINQSKNFNEITLKKIINRLVEIDAGFKRGQLDFKTSIEAMIAVL